MHTLFKGLRLSLFQDATRHNIEIIISLVLLHFCFILLKRYAVSKYKNPEDKVTKRSL